MSFIPSITADTFHIYCDDDGELFIFRDDDDERGNRISNHHPQFVYHLFSDLWLLHKYIAQLFKNPPQKKKSNNIYLQGTLNKRGEFVCERLTIDKW